MVVFKSQETQRELWYEGFVYIFCRCRLSNSMCIGVLNKLACGIISFFCNVSKDWTASISNALSGYEMSIPIIIHFLMQVFEDNIIYNSNNNISNVVTSFLKVKFLSILPNGFVIHQNSHGEYLSLFWSWMNHLIEDLIVEKCIITIHKSLLYRKSLHFFYYLFFYVK